MHQRTSTAYRAAVLLTLGAVACDAPLAPRHQPSRPADITSSQAGVHVYAGRLADSVVHGFDAVWARGSLTDYRELRRAWRKANGISDSVGDPRFTPWPMAPSVILTSGDGSYQPPPRVLSHYEALHFGYATQSTNVPDGVEAELTFVGDQADISLSNLTITTTSGRSYPFSGPIAQGPGVIMGCSDVVFTGCGTERRLNGAVTLGAAPTCNAYGSGSVSYNVANFNTSLGTIAGAGSSTMSAAAMGAISGTAMSCPDTGAPKSDPTKPTDSTGTSAGSPPPPASPPPTSDPLPPSTAGVVVHLQCEQGDLYQDGYLVDTVITCYAS